MWAERGVVYVWHRGRHALKCIVLGINHQSRMLIPPWPCAECGGNSVCGAKDNTAAFVPEENNTADDAALCRGRRPRSHASPLSSNKTWQGSLLYRHRPGLTHGPVLTLNCKTWFWHVFWIWQLLQVMHEPLKLELFSLRSSGLELFNQNALC